MAEDWESLKRDLELELEELKRYAIVEHKKHDLWEGMRGRFEGQFQEFRGMPAPANAIELRSRIELKKRLAKEWQRAFLVEDADLGRRGQGGVVRSILTLNDSIKALDAGSTKLSKRMLWLTWAIAFMTAVMVVDILAKWGEIVTERWSKNRPAVERQEAREKRSSG